MSATRFYHKFPSLPSPYPEFPLFTPILPDDGPRRFAANPITSGPGVIPTAHCAATSRKRTTWKPGGNRGGCQTGVTQTLTVQRMVGLFLDAKEINVQSGEMEQTTWNAYESFGERMIRVFGARPRSKASAPTTSRGSAKTFRPPTRACRRSTATSARSRRSSIGLDPAPTVRATSTDCPVSAARSSVRPKSALEREREEQGERVFYGRANSRPDAPLPRPSAEGDDPLRYQLRLRKFGLCEAAALSSSILTTVGLRLPAPRTPSAAAILWPETVEAVRVAVADRKQPNDPKYASRVFITKYGQPFRPVPLASSSRSWPSKIGMTREAADFYDLRRTCASIGIQSMTTTPCERSWGTSGAADMLGVYNRLQVSDERLRAVTDHIHDWLFP